MPAWETFPGRGGTGVRVVDTSQRHGLGTGESAREARTDGSHSESLCVSDSCIFEFRVG